MHDDGWFFDTELLVLAQRRGLRIHEVAVDWVDDPDSRVDIVSTAIGDLRGVGRLLIRTPLARFMMIGVVSTLAYAALYLLLRAWLSPDVSNALALAVDGGREHPGQPLTTPSACAAAPGCCASTPPARSCTCLRWR